MTYRIYQRNQFVGVITADSWADACTQYMLDMGVDPSKREEFCLDLHHTATETSWHLRGEHD